MAYPFRSWSSLKKFALPGSILVLGAPVTAFAFSSAAPWAPTNPQVQVRHDVAPALPPTAPTTAPQPAAADPPATSSPYASSISINGQSVPLPENGSYSTDIPQPGGSTHVEATKQSDQTGASSSLTVNSNTVANSTGAASNTTSTSVNITIDDQ